MAVPTPYQQKSGGDAQSLCMGICDGAGDDDDDDGDDDSSAVNHCFGSLQSLQQKSWQWNVHGDFSYFPHRNQISCVLKKPTGDNCMFQVGSDQIS